MAKIISVDDGGLNVPRSRNPATICTEPMARQSEAAECDINRIVAQFTKTGVLPQGFAEGVFSDVSEIGDYREAMERVRLADREFMKLPPQVRAEFGNDPLAFVEFAVQPENRDQMVAMGLLEPVTVKEPAPVVPVAKV